jgi:hypothetical protein
MGDGRDNSHRPSPPENRALFVVGALKRSGLDGGSLEAALCPDAIFFAPDRVAALCEVRRRDPLTASTVWTRPCALHDAD